ncbi:MAG: class II fructose-bisphosphate aldolase, partial [Acidobacteriota bacterium]|nr:class II fructose-bisphosphate aldolase [Acidobacteriota bacterium]
MPRISLHTLFEDARKRAYTACYCEAWNLESFEAVIDAAEETESPIIAGFNGGFLCHSGRQRAENLAHYATLGHALWQSSAPAVFLLNETDDFAQVELAIG